MKGKHLIEEGVRLLGNVELGEGVAIGAPAELNARDSQITIGDGCDIASYVTITTADSHGKCIGIAEHITREPVMLGEHVFVGQGAIILGGTRIGHHSVIGAGVVLHGQTIPPHSRVKAAPPIIEAGHYAPRNQP